MTKRNVMLITALLVLTIGCDVDKQEKMHVEQGVAQEQIVKANAAATGYELSTFKATGFADGALGSLGTAKSECPEQFDGLAFCGTFQHYPDPRNGELVTVMRRFREIFPYAIGAAHPLGPWKSEGGFRWRSYVWEGMQIIEATAEQDPDLFDVQFELAMFRLGLGRTLTDTAEYDKAKSLLKGAQQILATLRVEQPEIVEVRNYLADVLYELSRLMAATKDGPSALRYAEEALAVVEGKNWPKAEELRRQLEADIERAKLQKEQEAVGKE